MRKYEDKVHEVSRITIKWREMKSFCDQKHKPKKEFYISIANDWMNSYFFDNLSAFEDFVWVIFQYVYVCDDGGKMRKRKT